jgi:hypothetical protein
LAREIFEAIARTEARTFPLVFLAASGILFFGYSWSWKRITKQVKKQFERDAAGIIQIWSSIYN